MGNRPVMRVADALVIFEGPARIRWTADAGGSWTPNGLWPNRHDREELLRAVRDGRPVLVVLDEARTPVVFLRDEWERTPWPVHTALAMTRPRGTSARPGPAAGATTRPAIADEVLEVPLPFLDWLPELFASAADRFLRDTDALLATTPVALLPAVLAGEPLSEPVGETGWWHVRFLRRPVPATVSDARLAAAVRQLAAAVAAPCPAARDSADLVGR